MTSSPCVATKIELHVADIDLLIYVKLILFNKFKYGNVIMKFILKRFEYINHIYAWICSFPIFGRNVRSWLYRLAGAKIGRKSIFSSGCFIGMHNIEVGDYCFINTGAFIDGSAVVSIGNYVRIGPYVRILTGTHPINKSEIRRDPRQRVNLPTKIEDGCWIGMGVNILPGIVIARGCVIAAGAVVNKNTEPNGLYAGVPAVRIKDLEVDDDVGRALKDWFQLGV